MCEPSRHGDGSLAWRNSWSVFVIPWLSLSQQERNWCVMLCWVTAGNICMSLLHCERSSGSSWNENEANTRPRWHFKVHSHHCEGRGSPGNTPARPVHQDTLLLHLSFVVCLVSPRPLLQSKITSLVLGSGSQSQTGYQSQAFPAAKALHSHHPLPHCCPLPPSIPSSQSQN